MYEYDFQALTPPEFEDLANDLFQAEHHIRVERFKSGKDDGIDGRHVSSESGTTIIQAKHYARTGLPGLLRTLGQEKKSVDKLTPDRYVLFTSVPLSPANKRSIQELLSPHIRTSSDIIGLDELRDLVQTHSHVERKFYKLWIASTGVLYDIIHSATTNRSHRLAEEITRSERLFVHTSASVRAEKSLQDQHCVILTGDPGSGKTTIAKHLCAVSTTEGFDLVEIECPDEAFEMWQQGRRQVFYYDDFLGSNYLELLTNNKTRSVFRLISMVSEDDSKRFVLSTRTVILNAARKKSEVFRNHDSNLLELEVSTSDLNDLEKARVLYSHIYHLELSEPHRQAFLDHQRYRRVVCHKNYNPRLIESITRPSFHDGESSDQVWLKIEQALDNPETIWEHALCEQVEPNTRILVELVVHAAARTPEQNIRRAFAEMTRHLRAGGELHAHPAVGFDACLRIALGSLLSRWITDSGEARLARINPSLSDFVYGRRRDDVEFLIVAGRSLRLGSFFRQIESTVSIHSEETLRKVYDSLIQNFLEALDADYFAEFEDYCCKLWEACIYREFEIPRKARRVLAQGLVNMDEWDDCEVLIEDAIETEALNSEDPRLPGLLGGYARHTGDQERLVWAVDIASSLGVDKHVDFESPFISGVVDFAQGVAGEAYGENVRARTDVENIEEMLRDYSEQIKGELGDLLKYCDDTIEVWLEGIEENIADEIKSNRKRDLSRQRTKRTRQNSTAEPATEKGVSPAETIDDVFRDGVGGKNR